jgi:hypothetical protein
MRTLSKKETAAVAGGKQTLTTEAGLNNSGGFGNLDRGLYVSTTYTFPAFSQSPSAWQMDYDSGRVQSMNFFTPKGAVFDFIAEGVKSLWNRWH